MKISKHGDTSVATKECFSPMRAKSILEWMNRHLVPPPYIAMIIRTANGSGIRSTENRLSDLDIGLKRLVQRNIRPSVLNRVIMWLKRGRLSKGIEEEL